MCGIIGYTGTKISLPILLSGLERVEYRGYDSAGVAMLEDGAIQIFKQAGGPKDLSKKLQNESLQSTIGIGHTRWATHGEPNNINAHPHYSCDKKIAVVHNGIIENYATLKAELQKRGHVFISETDTEVIAHFIEDVMKKSGVSLEEAVRTVTAQLVGSFSILVIGTDDPHKVIAAMRGGVLLIGIGDQEFYAASDPASIIEHTKEVVYLKDNEMAILEPGIDLQLIEMSTNDHTTPYIETLEMNIEEIEKSGYDHFMQKEIMEQPASLTETMRGRVHNDGIVLGGIWEFKDKLINADKIIFIGCGTSWHAGLIGEYLLESIAKIPVEVEYASEFRYREPVIGKNDIVIAISQSGETADTLAGIHLAQESGATVLGICNAVGSTIARTTDAGIYLHAGPEIGVASTKAFTSQVLVIIMMTLMLALEKGELSDGEYKQLKQELDALPEVVRKTLEVEELVARIAKEYQGTRNCLYLGRGLNFPTALEGALKLKEISYIHAEGYPAAEMKHGPIALIDQDMPVIVIATDDAVHEKVMSNIEEIKARNGRIIAVVSEGNQTIKGHVDHVITVPKTHPILAPIVASIPLQLLSYHMAVLLGYNPDKPRNLAKSVTVE